MRKHMWIITLVIVLAIVSTGYVQKAVSLDYPKKDINMYIGFNPGGGSDVMTSMVRPHMEKILKVTLLPVYKPGSGGDVAMTEVSRAKPDGYATVVTCTPMVPMNPYVRKTQYSMSDFVYVANVVTDPGILVVNAQSPYGTLADFIKEAKNRPGKLSVGVSAVPSDDWFAMQMFQEAAQIQLNLVPFPGDGPSWQAAMAGHIDASSNNLGLVYSQIKAGKLRALAIMSEKRSAYVPDVPTFKEMGSNFTNGSARGFSMPKGTPKEIVDTYANALKQVIESEEFKAKAQATAFPTNFLGPEDYAAFMKREFDVS